MSDNEELSQTREMLERFWRLADPQGSASRGTASSFIAEAERRNAEPPPQVEAALLRFDECLLWAISLATALNFSTETPARPRIVYGALAGGISSLLFSIRHLATSGFDVPAKVLMRSVVEYVDILFLLVTHPDLVEAYAGVESFQEANEFWHRHLKSLKARKAAYEMLSPGFTSGAEFEALLAYQKQEEELMALASHGAYVAAWVSSFPNSGAGLEDGHLVWPGYLGAVTNASVRTLDYAVYALLPLYALSDFPYGHGASGEAVIQFDTSPVGRSVEARRHVLAQMLLEGASPDEN